MNQNERRNWNETLKTFQGGYLRVYTHHHQIPFVLISPPDALNLCKNPSQTDFSSGHNLSVNNKLLLCFTIRDSHLSTSAHGPAGGRASTKSQKTYPRATDVSAGAESMEHRMFVRRGEGTSIQRSRTRVVRAGNDGIGTRGGIIPSGVSEKLFIIVPV